MRAADRALVDARERREKDGTIRKVGLSAWNPKDALVRQLRCASGA